MNSRGFTLVELLVALGMMLMVSALVYSGVRPQVRNAGSQVRVAEMQQGTRGSFDLFARDLRMAGYGVDLTMPGVPPPVALETGQLLVLNGNFRNIKTTGNGAGSTVAVADSTGFQAGNFLVIKSYLGGEAARIAAVASGAVQLATPLARIYPAGSQVHQVERIAYQVSSGSLLRDGQPMVDGVGSIGIQYFLDDGTLVSDPAGVESRVRSAFINLQTHSVNAPPSTTGEQMTIQAEVRIRNLGLTQVNRS